MSVRVLVVDDSAVFGRVMKQALEAIPGVEIAGLCRAGSDALARMRAESCDLVTLDIEMPGLNGLDVLKAMRRENIKTSAIVVSSADDRAREMTMRALQLGALDLIPKPRNGADEDFQTLRDRLRPVIAAAVHRKEVQTILGRGSGTPSPVAVECGSVPVEEYGRRSGASRRTAAESAVARPAVGSEIAMPRRLAKPNMVLIGVSTGGPAALAQIIPALPADLRVPVLIVQHMPPLFTQTLAQKLDSSSGLCVSEAADGEIALPGHVYIAPGGKHLKVTAGRQHEIVLHTSADPPENNCRPAVDVLFRSAAEAFPGLSVAVVLTGMGRDGTAGLADLRAAGVFAIAQDELTCAVFGMPKEAIHAGVVDIIAPLPDIASEIVKAVR